MTIEDARNLFFKCVKCGHNNLHRVRYEPADPRRAYKDVDTVDQDLRRMAAMLPDEHLIVSCTVCLYEFARPCADAPV